MKLSRASISLASAVTAFALMSTHAKIARAETPAAAPARAPASGPAAGSASRAAGGSFGGPAGESTGTTAGATADATAGTMAGSPPPARGARPPQPLPPPPPMVPMPTPTPVPTPQVQESLTTDNQKVLNGALAPVPAPPVNVKRTIWTAHVIRQRAQEYRISDLNFPEMKLPVVLIEKDNKLRPLVEIKGVYAKPDWALYDPTGMPLYVDPKTHEFRLYAYLNTRISEASLLARGPKGETQSEHVYIFAPDAMEFKIVTPYENFSVVAGLGTLNYSQTQYGEYASLNGSLGVQYVSPEPKTFGYLGEANLTMLTLYSNPAEHGPQILEARADGTYRIPFTSNPQWRTHILLGADYESMLSNGSPFGFANLILPEVGMRTRFTQTSRKSWLGIARFQPIGDVLGFRQYGLNLRLGREIILENNHRLELGCDIKSIKYQADSATNLGLFQTLFYIEYGL